MADQYQDRVAAFDKTQGLALLSDAIDEAAGTIKGVSIATSGVQAEGHGEYSDEGELLREFWTDDQTLSDMLEACLAIGEPLKAKLEHGSGLMEIVGEFDNFRIDGKHLRADFTAYPTSSGKDHLFTLAKRLSKQFGVSVSAILAKAKKGAIDVMRCKEILSADFVDEPAINAGLFSINRIDKTTNVYKKPIHMEANEIKTLIEESMSAAMAPLADRLSKLEEGMKPDESELAAETAAKEEMSAKLTAAETELAAIKGELTELSKIANDAKSLGVKFGARISADQDDQAEKTFESELSKIVKAGTPRHLAVGELCAKNPALAKAEAKKQGKHIWQLS